MSRRKPEVLDWDEPRELTPHASLRCVPLQRGSRLQDKDPPKEANIKLRYDKGTLLLSGMAEFDLNAHHAFRASGFRFDERVKLLRAPAYCYRRTIERIATLDSPIQNFVFSANTTHPLQAQLDLLSSDKIKLRCYQQAALDSWRSNGKKGIVVLPTGSGKTILAAATIAECAVTALCVVPTLVLLHQWAAQLEKVFGGQNVGIFGEGIQRHGRIAVATYATALRQAEKLGNQYQLVIIDEAHHFGDNKYDEILVMSAAPYRLALTATLPESTLQLARLQKLVGTTVFNCVASDLVGSFLSSYEHMVFPVNLQPEEKRKFELLRKQYTNGCKAFRAKGLAPVSMNLRKTPTGRQAITARSSAARILNTCGRKIQKISELLSNFRGAKALVFMGSVEAAIEISAKLLIPVITGEIPKNERNFVLDQFRKGNINTIVTCQVLNEGFDLPATDLVIIAGGSKGKTELKQRIGRALRLKEQKSACIVELVSAGTYEMQRALKPLSGFLNPRLTRSIRGIHGN